MKRIGLQLVIAVITFLVGVAAARIANLRHAVNRSSPIIVEGLKQEPAAQPALQSVPHPKVKWLYISSPISWNNRDGSSSDSTIAIFYEDGQWGRVTPLISRVGTKLNVRFVEGCRVDLGKWKEDGRGNVVVTTEKRQCNACPLMRWMMEASIPEVWTLSNGSVGATRAHVQGQANEYRLLNAGRVLHLDDIVYLPFDFDDHGIID